MRLIISSFFAWRNTVVSREKLLFRLIEHLVLLQNKKIVEAPKFEDINWTVRLAYLYELISIFNYLNTLM